MPYYGGKDMKTRKLLKKIISGFVSFSLVLAIIPSNSFVTVTTANNGLPVLDYVDEYTAKSSTAIKNINNIVRSSSNSVQYSALLKRAGGYAALLGSSIDAIRGAVYSYDKNDKWYENIWNIGSGALSGFLGLNSSPASTQIIQYDLEEMKSLILDMDQDIQEINNKLDKLEESIQVNFENLSNRIKNIIEESVYKENLNEFTQASDRDAFSYYKFKENLYGYYKVLKERLENPSTTETSLKQAYDYLYLEAIKSEQLYMHLTGEHTVLTDGKSIQDILYDYCILSSQENFELECIRFSEDVYSTYLFAQYCLCLCYNYQLLYSEKNDGINPDDYYVKLENTTIEGIPYSTIPNRITTMLNSQNRVVQNMAKYICKVLRLNGEFDYTSQDIRFGTIPYNEISTKNFHDSVAYTSSNGSTVYYKTNNNLQNGDVIQICEMPDAYMSMFNPKEFHISVSNSNATLSNGVIKVVGASGSFDVIYSYDGIECYRVSFNIVQKYSGGLGIKNAPYLISTTYDFNSIRNSNSQCYYLLINDIDYRGSELPLINISTSGFGGIFDGGGHKIYNYQITSYGISNNQFNNSIFPIVKKDAIIKNLTIGNLDCKTYGGYSAQHQYRFGPGGYSLTVYNGILSGINEGIISNCNIQNVKINAGIEMSSNAKYFWSLDAHVGGFAAYNRGIIAHSVISNSNLTGIYKSNQAPCRLYIGGISGINQSSISNCFSLNNDIFAETTAASYIMSTQSLIFGGNIIGLNNGTTQYLFGENCRITMNPYGTHERRAIYGSQSSTMPSSGSVYSMEIYGWTARGDGKAIIDHNLIKEMCDYISPHKTVYYIGEELNLTGLELYYGNNIRKNLLEIDNKINAYGFSISGFDSHKTGTQTVTISYDNLSISFDVTVLCQHQWDGGVITTQATYTNDGIKTYTCNECKSTYTEIIPKLPITSDTVAMIINDVNATVGKTATMSIHLANNPGITSSRISVHYDNNLLKLINVSYNPIMKGQTLSPNNYEDLNGTAILHWTDGLNDYVGDDIFATLTFEISENAIAGTQSEVGITYNTNDIYNTNGDNVPFAIKSGKITFVDYLLGDVNDDGLINLDDVIKLLRHVSKASIITEPKLLAAGEIIEDGVLDLYDVIHLLRYVSKAIPDLR